MAKTNPITTDEVSMAARLAGVPVPLALAIWKQESSSGTNTKTSPKGAVGGFQVIPDTFRRYMPGGNINDPVDNMQAGLAVLSDGLKKARGDWEGAAQFYYHGRVLPPGKEGPTSGKGTPTTRQYGKQVMAKAQQIAASLGMASSAAAPTPALADFATPPPQATEFGNSDFGLSAEAEPEMPDMFGMAELDESGGEEEVADLGGPMDIAGYTRPLMPNVTTFGGINDVALNQQGGQDYEVEQYIRKLVDEELRANA